MRSRLLGCFFDSSRPRSSPARCRPGLPSLSSCMFSPSSVSPGGSAAAFNMAVSTTARGRIAREPTVPAHSRACVCFLVCAPRNRTHPSHARTAKADSSGVALAILAASLLVNVCRLRRGSRNQRSTAAGHVFRHVHSDGHGQFKFIAAQHHGSVDSAVRHNSEPRER